jgi:hypothetical protein
MGQDGIFALTGFQPGFTQPQVIENMAERVGFETIVQRSLM